MSDLDFDDMFLEEITRDYIHNQDHGVVRPKNMNPFSNLLQSHLQNSKTAVVPETQRSSNSSFKRAKKNMSKCQVLQDHGVVPLKNMNPLSNLLQSPDLQNSKIVVVPETQRPSNSSFKRAKKNVVSSKVTWKSSGSTLRLELDMKLQEAFDELVSRKMLNLSDVAHAQSYLSTSTWASKIFLREKDLGKRSAMIINPRKDDEEMKRKKKPV